MNQQVVFCFPVLIPSVINIYSYIPYIQKPFRVCRTLYRIEGSETTNTDTPQLPTHPPTPQKKILAKRQILLLKMDGLAFKTTISLPNLDARKRKINGKEKKKHQTVSREGKEERAFF